MGLPGGLWWGWGRILRTWLSGLPLGASRTCRSGGRALYRCVSHTCSGGGVWTPATEAPGARAHRPRARVAGVPPHSPREGPRLPAQVTCPGSCALVVCPGSGPVRSPLRLAVPPRCLSSASGGEGAGQRVGWGLGRGWLGVGPGTGGRPRGSPVQGPGRRSSHAPRHLSGVICGEAAVELRPESRWACCTRTVNRRVPKLSFMITSKSAGSGHLYPNPAFLRGGRHSINY